MQQQEDASLGTFRKWGAQPSVKQGNLQTGLTHLVAFPGEDAEDRGG